jgi:hypothetical protein
MGRTRRASSRIVVALAVAAQRHTYVRTYVPIVVYSVRSPHWPDHPSDPIRVRPTDTAGRRSLAAQYVQEHACSRAGTAVAVLNSDLTDRPRVHRQGPHQTMYVHL